MISRRLFPQVALLAAFALLLAQILLASHEIKHLGHFDEDSCEVCLTANAIGSLLTSSPSTPAFPLEPAPLEQASDYKPASTSYFRVHHARAPPIPVRS